MLRSNTLADSQMQDTLINQYAVVDFIDVISVKNKVKIDKVLAK